jgi:hypothetical protein
MSVDAPPPVTPIRDARIEGAPAPLCRTAAMIKLGHRVQRGAAVVDTPSVEGWVTVARTAVPRPTAARGMPPKGPDLLISPGHREGVFRPPRAI